MTTQIDPRMDFYKALDVSESADAEEIKKAYRKLAKKYHPDRTGGDKVKEARFKEISQAYDVLGDSAKRKQYDAMRSGGFSGFPGGRGAGGASAEDLGGLGDLFAQMFSGGGARSAPGGVHFRYNRGAQRSPFGNGRPRSQPRPRAPGAPAERKLALSDGSAAVQRGGNIYADVRLPLDQAILGAVVEVPTLDGTTKIKVPPGTSSGVKLRLKGKGGRKRDGGRGNHYVTIQIDVPRKLDEKAKKLLIQFMRQTQKT